MKWPGQRALETRVADLEAEVRADTFTERLLEQRVAEAAGDVTAAAIATVEACASLYGRAFAGLEIEADGWLIEPHSLEALGRSVYRDGQAMLLRRGGTASSWTVYGADSNPDSWYYDVTISAPSNTTTIRMSAAEVALLRINATAAAPWRGQSPLTGASTTVRLAQRLEACLTDEHNAAVGGLLTVPTGTPQAALERLRDDLKGLGGRTALVESTRGGWSDGRQTSPQRDWQQQRIGPETPVADVSLRRQLELDIYAASGIPPSLMSEVSGTESREAWRQFVTSAIRPLARQLQTELRRSAPTALVRFEGLGSDELSQKARSFNALVKGGMSVEQAIAVTGLLTEQAQ